MITERKVKKKLQGIHVMCSNNRFSDKKHKNSDARVKKRAEPVDVFERICWLYTQTHSSRMEVDVTQAYKTL